MYLPTAILETERLRDLLQNGNEIFQKVEEAERHAILFSATDQVTWPTGYWKEDSKEAMRFRCGPETIEIFYDEMLSQHIQTAKG